MSRAALLDELSHIEAELARRRLIEFTLQTFPEFEANWHHHIYAEYLERVFRGELRRVIFCMPPQNGKSELISRRFPAWALGRNPDLRIIATSYGDDLANTMSRDVQKIMDSAAYRRIFPSTRLGSGRDDEQRTIKQFAVVGHRGYYVSAGISGAIAGKTSDIGIVDDPFKGRSDADSEATRDRVWNDFVSAFLNRQFGNTGRIVVTTTRWHEDDLAGRLLNHAKDGGEAWELVSFPAVAEAPLHPRDPRAVGEPLWPSKYPLDELARRKRYSLYEWNALFQQRPAPAEGGLLKRAWWRYYDADSLADGRPGPSALPLSDIVISVDPATRAKDQNDFSAVGCWGLQHPHIYGLKVLHDRFETPELARQIRDLHAWAKEKWPHVIPRVVVENTAAGPDVIEMLKQRVQGVLPESVKGDKVQRVHAVIPLLEGRNVWLPGAADPTGRVLSRHAESGAQTPAWVEPFVDECASFPTGSHDDRVDMWSQAMRHLDRPKIGAAWGDIPGLY